MVRQHEVSLGYEARTGDAAPMLTTTIRGSRHSLLTVAMLSTRARSQNAGNHAILRPVIGWLMWNTMRVLAALGLAILGGSVLMLIGFMFEVGLAWVSFVVIAGALVLLAVFVRRVLTGLRPSTSSSAASEIIE